MESEETKVNLSELKLTPQSEPCSQASLSDMSPLDPQRRKASPSDQKVPSKNSPLPKVDYKKDTSDLKSNEKEKRKKKSRHRSRSRSRGHKRKRSKSRSIRHKDKKSKKSRSLDRNDRRTHKSKKSKKRSRSRSRHRRRHKKSPLVIENIIQDKKMDKIIDKKRLLELAKVDRSERTDPNFVNIFRAPAIPQPKLTFIREDRSIDQFVELCKNLTNENSAQNEPVFQNFSNKTYLAKENDCQIFDQHVNQSAKEDTISQLFPVSSGSQHRGLLENTDDPIEIEDKISNTHSLLDNIINDNSNLGRYTGLSDAKFLTPDQLEGEFKAWTKKDLWTSGNRMTTGIGKKLLEKMGWKEGEGLGRNREGPIEPIKLDIKLNRKGLEAEGLVRETLQKQIEGKHPVSCLLELSRVRKWSDPVYEVVEESGPAHQKNFMFKVILNGVAYQPSEPSANKKLAKAMAAFVCLQSFGIQSTIPS